jgi:ribosomal protein L15
MPLQRRIPKGGFTPLNRVEYQVINLRTLQEMEENEITPRCSPPTASSARAKPS